MSFSQRQKILKCLWSKNFELKKCGYTEKSNHGLNLSIILMFLTIYGVGKSQCDRSIFGLVFEICILFKAFLTIQFSNPIEFISSNMKSDRKVGLGSQIG